jgi:hypothetical protein
MRIKFNWGTGIFIVIVLIFGGVIAFFIYSTSLDINLVENNYYEKELVYEERIQKIRNADNLAEKIRIESIDGYIVLHFPDTLKNAAIKGSILFYRPSDEGKDFTLPISLDDSLRQFISKENIFSGKYLIKMEWEMDGIHYYQEEVLINQ